MYTEREEVNSVTPGYQEYQSEPITSRYYEYDEEPEVLQPKGEVPELPKRPHPEEFHERIENQLDFSNKPKSLPSTPSTIEPFYEEEAVSTPTPIYIPKTTYGYENDYQQEVPVRPEVMPEPEPIRRTRQNFYTEEPEYYKYDPMDYSNKRPSQEPPSIEEFPQLLPFDEIDREFSSRSLDMPINPNSRMGAGRALGFSSEPRFSSPRRSAEESSVYPVSNKVEEPYQFTHVDAPHTFRAGHSRGNHYHNVKDIEEHDGAHHLQEVRSQLHGDGYDTFSR